jgi:hypothetical protein
VVVLAGGLLAPTASAKRAARTKTLATVHLKLPAEGQVTLAVVYVPVQARHGTKLPKHATLKISNRARLPRTLIAAGVAGLSRKVKIKGRPTYGAVVALLNPAKSSSRRAHAAEGDLIADLIIGLGGVHGGGIVTIMTPNPNLADPNSSAIVYSVFEPPVTSGDDCFDVLGLSPQAAIVDLGETPDAFFRSAARPPAATLLNGAVAGCGGTAPASFYSFMNVPPPEPKCMRADTGCAAPLSYTCSGPQKDLFDNTNTAIVSNGGYAPAFETNGSWCVTYIQTYHYNGGKGSPPGKIGLQRVRGSATGLPGEVGPFQSQASGQDWFVDVPLAPQQVIEGRYVCFDSNPATWSANRESGGQGFCIVRVVPAVPSTTRAAPALSVPFPG